MNKKAIFFTLLSILFINVFILGSRLQIDYTYYDSLGTSEFRIKTLEDLIESLEKDASRALYISGFRALVSLGNYVIETGNPVDLDMDFEEAIINSSIEGNISALPLMKNQSLPFWRERMIALAKELNVTMQLNYSNISIRHESPWSIKIQMRINYTLNDDFGLVYYNRSEQVITSVSIVNWLDPLYAMKTSGSARSIIPANYTSWNISTFKSHFIEGTYHPNTDAPSYLDRLEGKTTADVYGIETIINPNDFGNPGNRSMVDHLFWGAAVVNTSRVHNITDEGYPGFFMDETHLNYYNIATYKY